ncbi:MAG: hypothetical protein JSR67_07610 [Proteobacteria bacterium]|nr:hypothetical protein [Pseudomonadota bacterium]
MHSIEPVFAAGTAARLVLEEAASRARCVVICGIPGVGKSLFLHQQVLLARLRGRRVQRMEWDVVRLAFEQPAILASYPEIDDVTHPVIRRAAGLWARQALSLWSKEVRTAESLLVIEAPLIGGRFVELARVVSDAAESLLAGSDTLFLVPQPSRAVRSAIEVARAQESAQHRHALDSNNAPPPLVDALWRQVLDTADVLGVARDRNDLSYSPELYFAVYRLLLRHRQVRAVPVTEVVALAGSPHDLDQSAPSLAPTARQARELIAQLESAGIEGAIRSVQEWHRV